MATDNSDLAKNIKACIDQGGILVPVSASAMTTGENSPEPDHLVVQCITRKKPYFVMLPYYKAQAQDETRAFVAAAEFKKQRLQRQYPDALIEVIQITTPDDFTHAWNHINGLLTGPQIQYELREVHYFGHSDFDKLHLLGGSISYNEVRQLPQLPWSSTAGASALVLHSCRSSRFEARKKLDEIEAMKCIANAFSQAHKVRVIGQVVYATNNTGDAIEDWKYRNSSSENKQLIDVQKVSNVVLWGYCAGGSSLEFADTSEYWNLKSGQIWPCRGFINGTDYARIVQKNVFNDFDLKYI